MYVLPRAGSRQGTPPAGPPAIAPASPAHPTCVLAFGLRCIFGGLAMSPRQFLRAVLVGGVIVGGSATASAQVGWMTWRATLVPRGAVDGSGPTSSNAEEAFLIEAVIGTSARVVRHAALKPLGIAAAGADADLPRPRPGPLLDAPAAPADHRARRLLARSDRGDHGGRAADPRLATFVNAVLPGKVHLLPVKALFDLQATRQLVKLSYYH